MIVEVKEKAGRLFGQPFLFLLFNRNLLAVYNVDTLS